MDGIIYHVEVTKNQEVITLCNQAWCIINEALEV